MKILVTLENPERTGAPKMAAQYAGALASAGHRVVAACGPPSEGTSSVLPELRRAGVDVRRTPALGLRSAPAVLGRLRSLIREGKVSCVVGFQQRDRVLACLAAAGTDARCVISAQNQHVFRGGPVESRAKERVYGWALRGGADLVVCSSGAVEEEVLGRFGVEVGRTAVVPNGIDVRDFPTFGSGEREAARRELGVSGDERLLLNVGRIDRQKGQDLLLRALRDVDGGSPGARLGMAGTVGRSSAAPEGHGYRDRLRSIAREAGMEDRVAFLGWRDDVPRLLAAADLYVQPSRWEGWPLALVEAMAAGVPVVASDCSGRPRGFRDGEHGWIVPAGDVEALREALERGLSLSGPELREMGGRARRLAERHYDVRRHAARFVELVEAVVPS